MRQFLSRAAAVVAVLLVTLPATAGAAVDDHAAEATTSAVLLSVFEGAVDDPVLDLIGTDAFGSSDPMASASIDVVEVLGTPIGEVRSAESDRDRVRDPEDGDGCTLPATAPGLTLSAICTTTTARAGDPGDTGNQDANASAELLDVGVNGSFLADVLTTPLGDVVRTAGDLLVEGAIDEFLAECNEIIASIEGGVPPEVPATAGELLGMAPEELDPLADEVQDFIGDADEEGYCAAVFNLTVEPLSDAVLDITPILDALSGRDLVTLSLDGASSDIAGTDTAMTATATQVFATATGPSLDFLDDVIIALVDAIVAEIEEIAGGGEPLPIPGELDLSEAFDAIPLFGITDPLLTAVVSGGAATADLDLDSGQATAGGDEPFVQISFAGGLMELFGQDPESGTVTLAAGESQTIAEDTPLASTVSVGAVTTDDDAEFEDTGLRGSTATASVTTVSLLSEVEGGIVLSLAESNAGVYGSTVTATSNPPDEDDPLPNTGGGAAAAAALALGAALVLRRRRD